MPSLKHWAPRWGGGSRGACSARGNTVMTDHTQTHGTVAGEAVGVVTCTDGRPCHVEEFRIRANG